MPAWRMFIASPTVVTVQNVSAELDQAMEVLRAADLLGENQTRLLVAAERDPKTDVVHFAHHLVSLASALRGSRR